MKTSNPLLEKIAEILNYDNMQKAHGAAIVGGAVLGSRIGKKTAINNISKSKMNSGLHEGMTLKGYAAHAENIRKMKDIRELNKPGPIMETLRKSFGFQRNPTQKSIGRTITRHGIVSKAVRKAGLIGAATGAIGAAILPGVGRSFSNRGSNNYNAYDYPQY